MRTKTKTTKPLLEAKHPERLRADRDLRAAKDELDRAERWLEYIEAERAEHAATIAELDRVHPTAHLMTHSEALKRGSGSGFEIVYRSNPHDPRRPLHSDTDVMRAKEAVANARKGIELAERRKAKTPEVFDVIEACRDAGTRLFWWPPTSTPDVYKGKPIRPEELVTIPDVDQKRRIRFIREIPTL